ncbi:MAG: hypothetical protein V3U37_07385 [Nitrospinaceae bacterium]
MRRIYFFMFLAVWMFAACSSTGGNVQTDASATETPQEMQAAATAEAGAGDNGGEVFHHAGAGFSITKPHEWKYLSPEMVMAARQSMKLNDEDLEKMIKENPNAPLVVFTRYQEPYPTLNPSVAITLVHLPVEGIPPKDVLNMSTEVLKRAYPDLTYVDEVQDANVDGINSAYTKVKYTLAAGDLKFPTLTRMWLVPRGKVLFTVGMSGPQEGPDVSEESFQEILKSITFDK